MIKRDKYDIICQHSPYNDLYMDAGDSARATGMMSMTGSEIDKSLLKLFEISPGIFCRHPYAVLYKNPNNFTRDQLVQFIAGADKANLSDLSKRVFWTHAKRGFFCQNSHDLNGNKKPWYKSRDPLMLSHVGQLIISARIYFLYPLLVFCGIWLLLDIIFSSLQDVNTENNQIIALCSVYNKWFLKLYCFLDKKWEDKLMVYWGTNSEKFRYQPEIGEFIIKYIKESIS